VVKAVVVVDEERNAANKAVDAKRAFMIATIIIMLSVYIMLQGSD